MEIIGLTASPSSSGSYALILQEAGGVRRMSILIGQEAAQNIALEMEAIRPPRPVTHDLLKAILDALGTTVTEIIISELRDSIYFAQIVLDGIASEIDARPSDAIALAIRCGAPVYVSEEVLNEAAVEVSEEEEAGDEEEETEEDEVEQPNDVEVPVQPRSVRDILESKLAEAVKNEDYERAAQIRDELERLQHE